MIKQKTGLISYESRKKFFMLMTAITTLGIILGSCMAVSENNVVFQNNFFNQYISPVHRGNTLLEITKNTFISSSSVIAVIFCTGFFAVGQPASMLALIYRGFGIGLSVAITYMTFGKNGFYITLIFIIPKILATSVIIMLGARESIKLSNIIYSYLFRGISEDNMTRYIRLYCIKFIVLIFFCFVTAVADGGLNYFFGYLL